jgi:uncharacterized membrane protein
MIHDTAASLFIACSRRQSVAFDFPQPQKSDYNRAMFGITPIDIAIFFLIAVALFWQSPLFNSHAADHYKKRSTTEKNSASTWLCLFGGLVSIMAVISVIVTSPITRPDCDWTDFHILAGALAIGGLLVAFGQVRLRE